MRHDDAVADTGKRQHHIALPAPFKMVFAYVVFFFFVQPIVS